MHTNPNPLNKGATSLSVMDLVTLALTLMANAALEALSFLVLLADGTSIEFGKLKLGQVQPNYLIGDGKALSVVASLGNNALLIGGTPGIMDNPAFATVVMWVQAMMAKARRHTAFFATPPGEIAYYILVEGNRIVEINLASLGFAQVAAVRLKGLVARSAGNDGVLYFLSIEDAIAGRVGSADWRRIVVRGVEAITNVPRAIEDPANVLCSVVIGGKPGALALNFTKIEQGNVTVSARADEVDAACYLGQAGPNAVIEAGTQTRHFPAGTSYAAPALLEQAFGPAGRRIATTAPSATA